MTHRSDPALLAVHGVRVLGFPTSERVAVRFGLDADLVEELLRDDEAVGLVRHVAFAGASGWSLTERGKVEGERRLAAELDALGARAQVAAVHERFLPLNQRFVQTCTDWQVRPLPGEPLASNDHTDFSWDDRVFSALAAAGSGLRRLCDELAVVLARFAPYPALYQTALDAAEHGDPAWLDASDRDSCHLVWLQLHEDLLATLGLDRGAHP